VLAEFPGGRVVVGVTSTPFKCPPAPSETALLVHDLLTERGLRDSSEIALVMPLGAPIPPSPDATAALLEAFAERGIAWHPEQLITSVDGDRRVLVCASGTELPYDLFLAVPVHRPPTVVLDSGMCVDGWIPVDPLTLETAFPGVYAVGDVTSVGTPKAGVFAEGQASVAAQQIAAAVRGQDATETYDGTGICYLEFGHDQVAKVEVTFLSGKAPHGDMEGPSSLLAEDKVAFGTSRIRRWFGRDWATD
jgi:sulfide:quinone oxidoreductase